MSRGDSRLIYVLFFTGTAFLLGVMALLVIGPTSPIAAEIPLTWVLAFVLLLIGPAVGTLIAIIWPGGGGGGR